MKKEIKDYLHLYLGCQAMCGKVIGVLNEVAIDTFNKTCVIGVNGTNHRYKADKVKLFLRKLSDMTEEEMSKYYSFWSNIKPESPRTEGAMRRDAEATRYLLSKHFDLFNLIPEGLALDKTTL